MSAIWILESDKLLYEATKRVAMNDYDGPEDDTFAGPFEPSERTIVVIANGAPQKVIEEALRTAEGMEHTETQDLLRRHIEWLKSKRLDRHVERLGEIPGEKLHEVVKETLRQALRKVQKRAA